MFAKLTVLSNLHIWMCVPQMCNKACLLKKVCYGKRGTIVLEIGRTKPFKHTSLTKQTAELYNKIRALNTLNIRFNNSIYQVEHFREFT